MAFTKIRRIERCAGRSVIAEERNFLSHEADAHEGRPPSAIGRSHYFCFA